MSSQCFVVDEWCLHDLRGDNAQEAQEETARFLERLKARCDQIAVLRGSSWMEKAYELMTHSNPPVRTLSKCLHQGILLDSKKCQLLDPDEIRALPDDLRGLVPQNDLYLFEAYYSANAKALVTTDQRLCQILSTAQNINVDIRLRDDFLKRYLRDNEHLDE